MSRLVIDMSREQHQQIKTLAAISGKSIKDFVLEKLFPSKMTQDEQKAWNELQAMLNTRISNAKQGAISKKTFNQITDETIKEHG